MVTASGADSKRNPAMLGSAQHSEHSKGASVGGTIIGLSIGVGILCLGCDRATGSPDARFERLEMRVSAVERQRSFSDVGRYQIVNPTPAQVVLNTMLLDTATGHTWIVCNFTDLKGTKANGWCDMTQAAERGTP